MIPEQKSGTPDGLRVSDAKGNRTKWKMKEKIRAKTREERTRCHVL
jgi:hypothetical protein